MSLSRTKRIYLAVAAVAVVALVFVTVLSLVSSKRSGEPSQGTSTDQVVSEVINADDPSGQIVYQNIARSSRSVIGGYASIVKNLPSTRQDEANRLLLYTLLQNGVSTAPTDSTIRRDSYAQAVDQATSLYTTTYIVDIPSLQQSYRITDRYSPAPASNPKSYATVVTCLNEAELIYAPFSCTDQLKQERGY